MDKSSAYRDLVFKRKGDERTPWCRLCEEWLDRENCGLTNSAAFEYDTDQIGPWSDWQGNLDADILIVGQDWGDIATFQEFSGKNEPSPGVYKFKADANLVEFLELAGMDIGHPLKPNKAAPLFLTNAVLCLKPKMDTPVKSQWRRNCGPLFLRPLIEIIRPKLVIALGEDAYKTIKKAYNRPRYSFSKAVKQGQQKPIDMDGFSLVPVFHPSPKGMIRHKPPEHEQIWRRIGEYITALPQTTCAIPSGKLIT